jgi:hypothetical protein
MFLAYRLECRLTALLRGDRRLGRIADRSILPSDRRMFGLQLSTCGFPIRPVHLPAPRNPKELEEEQLQRMDDLRHLPALQTLVPAHSAQVGHHVIGPMVEKLSALPGLDVLLDTNHIPAGRRGRNPTLVDHSEVSVPKARDPIVPRKRAFHRFHWN